jgi:hypothetical protein
MPGVKMAVSADIKRLPTADADTLSERVRLAALIALHIVVYCASLYLAAKAGHTGIVFDAGRGWQAVVIAAGYGLVFYAFLVAPFSFGYLSGFYMSTVILGFLWLNCFSERAYDHFGAGVSAALSGIAFLVPLLFVNAPIRQICVLSERNFERLLNLILLLAIAAIAIGASYHFSFVSIEDSSLNRDQLEFPGPLRYLFGITTNALLPFAFACFAVRNDRIRAAATLILLLLFYPVTTWKLALLAPSWLVYFLLLSRLFRPRLAVILSLLGPLFVGALMIAIRDDVPLLWRPAQLYFGTVNFRLMIVPVSAIDVYNDFFSSHDHTWFCQISILKRFIGCPYTEQLGIVMNKAYVMGNFNASLFATEGIASVGLLLAPVSALICGLIVAAGNRLSAGLPPRFVLLSGAVVVIMLLNAPLTTVLLTNGLATLFLLWYLTPRTMFADTAGS